MDENPVFVLVDAIQKRQAAVLATVVAVEGSSPTKAGAQIVLLSDGRTAGTVGGGNLESAVLQDAQEVFATKQPGMRTYALTESGQDAVGSLCGGALRVFLHPYFPPPHLVVAGGGHIGQPLKVMGEAAGFQVSVVDVEPGRATVPALEQVNLSQDSYVVVITTDHISDEAVVRYALDSAAPYIGMIGSQGKCRIILEHLQADYSPEDMERVFAPIGLDLGGDQPEEIAVSILAEVIAVRYKRSQLGSAVRIKRTEPSPAIMVR